MKKVEGKKTDMNKSLYKAVLSHIKKSHNKKTTKEIVEDILDPNTIAQVDPNKIPPKKSPVLLKSSVTVDEAMDALEDVDVDELMDKMPDNDKKEFVKRVRQSMEKGKLSESCKAKLRAKFKVYPSAVANLNAGRVCKSTDKLQIINDIANIKKSLRRWVKEKWTNEDGKPCGSGDKGSSQKCRPSKKVNSKTPKTWGSMDRKEKEKAVRQKRRATKEGKKYANHQTGKTYGKR